jgi:hypothetical protein
LTTTGSLGSTPVAPSAGDTDTSAGVGSGDDVELELEVTLPATPVVEGEATFPWHPVSAATATKVTAAAKPRVRRVVPTT